MILIIIGLFVLYISWIIFLTGIVCTCVGAAGVVAIIWSMFTSGYDNILLLYLLLASGLTTFGILCLKLLWPKSKKKPVEETVQHLNSKDHADD